MFPGIAKSVAACMGAGAAAAGTAGIHLDGTAAVLTLRDGEPAAPFGMCHYRVDATRHCVEATVSNAGNLRSWCLRELRIADGPDLDAALAGRTGPKHGLVVLPSWSPERSPDGDEDAAGTIHGIRQTTSALDILQALVEAPLHRIAFALELLSEEGSRIPKIVASGPALQSPASVERLANVLGCPIFPSSEPDPILRGAAISVLERLGYPAPVAKSARAVKPRTGPAHEYAAARERHRKLKELF